MSDPANTPQPVRTDDGSLTCFHPDYKEHYHARQGARSEAIAKFIGPSQLAIRLQKGDVALLDIGFGLGGNAFAALDLSAELGCGRLNIHSLENDPQALPRALACAHASHRPWIQDLIATGSSTPSHGKLTLHFSDLRMAIRNNDLGPVDVIFHDPFSPQKNVEAWTQDLFAAYRRCLRPDGVFVTYSEAFAVRAGLIAAGFHVGQSAAIHGHRGGTVACMREEDVLEGLPAETLALLRGPKGTPYRDPELTATRKEIMRRRQREMEHRTRVSM